MSILGIVVRARPSDLAAVAARVAALPGTDQPLNPGDGRMVVVIEDAWLEGQAVSAAATMAAITQWPEVLNTSLVYEYSGPDAPAPAGSDAIDYRSWRDSLAAPAKT
jgi:nitrate reductase NapAB chaperone NapD